MWEVAFGCEWETDRDSRHLADINEHWRHWDRKESLITAIIRLGLRSGILNYEGLRAVRFMFEASSAGCDLKPCDLPPECWVWMAESTKIHCGDPYCYYYAYWIHALESASVKGDLGTTFDARIVLILGRILGRVEWDFDPAIPVLVNDLIVEGRGTPFWPRVQKAIGFADALISSERSPHVSYSDREAIMHGIEIIASEVDASLGTAIDEATRRPYLKTPEFCPPSTHFRCRDEGGLDV
jgi:hypothetical protein